MKYSDPKEYHEYLKSQFMEASAKYNNYILGGGKPMLDYERSDELSNQLISATYNLIKFEQEEHERIRVTKK